MTTKDAIKGLKTIRTVHNGNYAEHIDMAIKALEQTRWIPLNAKGYEPQKNGMYLTCFDDGYITTLYYENGDWLIDNYCPIAWMPLPEPYKVERFDVEFKCECGEILKVESDIVGGD